VRAKPKFGQPIARLVFAVDERLRRRNAVIDYSDHPDCMSRIKITALTGDVPLADGVRLRRGDRIVELHFRNEHFPRMDRHGATIEWASRAKRRIDFSLRELCVFLNNRAEFDDITGVRATMPVRGLAQLGEFERIAARFGFELTRNLSPSGFAGWMLCVGQNALGLLLVLAGNPEAARFDILWRGAATAFLSRRALNRRCLDRRLNQPSGRSP
jgi:YkoP domain